MTLPQFTPTDWTLATHGDSRQRHWARRVATACPHYEPFWQHHIVPLTFRPYQPDNYFLRPTQRKQLLDLADTSYAVFLHLTGAMQWSDWLLQKRDTTAHRPTDCAYYFFSHTYSLQEAAGSFADAVNRALERYKADPCFPVQRSPGNERWNWGRSGVAERFWKLRQQSSPYRNALVHERPLFVQTDSLPAPDDASIKALSGLTAITRLARDGSDAVGQTLPAREVVGPILEAAADLADALWATARRELDGVTHPKYREDQLTVRPGDRELSLDRILAVRRLQ